MSTVVIQLIDGENSIDMETVYPRCGGFYEGEFRLPTGTTGGLVVDEVKVIKDGDVVAEFATDVWDCTSDTRALWRVQENSNGVWDLEYQCLEEDGKEVPSNRPRLSKWDHDKHEMVGT